MAKKTRRAWTEAQKRALLKKADKLKEKGESVTAFFKEQGVYSSQIATWRKQLNMPTTKGRARPNGDKPKAPPARVQAQTQSMDPIEAVQTLVDENTRLRSALVRVQEKLQGVVA